MQQSACMFQKNPKGRTLGDGHSPHSSAGEQGTGVSMVVGRIGKAAQGLGSRACEASTPPQSYNPSLQKAFYTNLASIQIVKE